MKATLQSDCERFHRRDFLTLGSVSLLGLSLADLLRLEAPGAAGQGAKASGVILVWLAGGPATIDMWDLKPDAPANIRGEFKPISTSASGVTICEHLPKMARVMDRCALVRSLTHNIPAHGPGTVYMATGHLPTPALEYPSLGSLASKLVAPRPGVPSYVTFSDVRGNGFAAGAGYLGTAHNPFEVEGSPQRGRLRVEGVSLPDGFPVKELEDRNKLRARFDRRFKALDEADIPASLDRFHQQALDILRSDRTRKAFDLEQEPAAVRDAYGPTSFGQSALAARRLIEAGVRFVTIGLGGWDTHQANFATLRGRLLPQLDQTLSALIGDLAKKGLLDSTLVYCAGEFNRTPRINGTAGRDHWSQSMAVLLSGGGIRKGVVHGRTDGQGMSPAQDACSPADVSATIFRCLGFDPQHDVTTPTGRPLAIFREGKVLRSLLP
jgi:hypothetical protein